jgi:phosphoglucomutase
VGKTIVSSAIIDRVVQSIGRRLAEVPVGFKWFADGLQKGTYCFGGEESAGASFLRLDGTVWTTDKDGIILGLLAAEIRARTGLDPAEYFQHLTALLGRSHYRRLDTQSTPDQKRAFKSITAASAPITHLAGDRVTATLTHDPTNNASIGGLKIVTENGWFAARPSGTENIIKIYAESFKSAEHLAAILEEAQAGIAALTAAGSE